VTRSNDQAAFIQFIQVPARGVELINSSSLSVNWDMSLRKHLNKLKELPATVGVRPAFWLSAEPRA
jgi:hypothetical protein